MSTIGPNCLMHGGTTTGSGVFLSTQCPFNTEELDEFFNTGSSCPFDGYQFISKERLINTLNKITQEPQGLELLMVLKTNLQSTGKKVSFITFCGDEALKEFNDNYAFNSENSLREGSIVISIKNSPHESITRFAFDGQKIVECHVNNIEPELYHISHELVHAVSFLESDIADNMTWQGRKEDWVTFLTTDRMKPIKEVLLDAGLSQDEIRNCFKKFFTNTEEARNLLGFITRNRSLIGEFCFFNGKSNFLLPTYLDKISVLNSTEINFLRKIGEALGIQFQATGSCFLL